MHHALKLTLAFSLLSCVLAFAVSGCAPQQGAPVSGEDAFLTTIAEVSPIELQPGEKLRVVATTNIVFDVLENVAGGLVELEALIPRGADPHVYEPSPGDLRKLTQADLVFINGVDLEEPLHPTLSEISSDTVIVSLSEGLTLMSFNEPEHAEEDEDGDHDHGGLDPHIWLDPLNVQAWALNAADALSTIDPGRADRYLSNAGSYAHKLEDLHHWIEQQLTDVPADKRKLVTDHRALGYFATRYSFELIATVIPAYSTAAEPLARELGELVNTIEAESVQAIFVGSNANTTIAKRIAEDTGIHVVPLYIGTLSSADGPAGNYIEMMKYNVEAIASALSDGG